MVRPQSLTVALAALFLSWGNSARAAGDGWRLLLGSVGAGGVTILRADDPADPLALAGHSIVVVQGCGVAAQRAGISFEEKSNSVRDIVDTHAPEARIYWQQAVSLSVAHVPPAMQVFARDRWSGQPLLAGRRTLHGALLWIATDPGDLGYERFPYLLNALVDLGLNVSAQSTSLWAFFDSAYRIRADPEFLAARWRAAGVSRLFIAGWHNMEPDKVQDAYLASLIEACHRNAVLVYVWLELPHVSEAFWARHPSWREKTANGQDAQLDWRKLMNLQSPECRAAVQVEVSSLIRRFDWDGVNIAELYFESLEGASNPARFTPMNDDVRAAFQREAGFDPKTLWTGPQNSEGLRQFLNFRAGLAAQLQSDWLAYFDRERVQKPFLDAVLTHIDDRFEPGIRDALGADVSRTLPLLAEHRATLMVEDPATLWNLGPDRYRRIATEYQKLTNRRDLLAVDINVVDRYQDVYPTKKQTGGELMELVHEAASSFRRVALYFESSLEALDLPLLPAAASTSQVRATAVDTLEVEGADPVRIAWQGPAEVDGKAWPLTDSRSVLLPPGKHTVTPGIKPPHFRVIDFNGELRQATMDGHNILISYNGRSRAFAVVQGELAQVDVDGASAAREFTNTNGTRTFMLPPGQHLLTLQLKQ